MAAAVSRHVQSGEAGTATKGPRGGRKKPPFADDGATGTRTSRDTHIEGHDGGTGARRATALDHLLCDDEDESAE